MIVKILKTVNCIICLTEQIVITIYKQLISSILNNFNIKKNDLIKLYRYIIILITSIYNKSIKYVINKWTIENIRNLLIIIYRSLYANIIDFYFVIKENKTLNLYKLYREFKIIKENKEIYNMSLDKKILYYLFIMCCCALIGPIYITLFVI